MKKILFVAIAGIFLASCAGNGWSCKKRYCDAKEKPVEKTRNS